MLERGRIMSKQDSTSAVNRPSHYNQGDVECIDGLRSALGDDEFAGFCRGNVIKYLWRAGKKSDSESQDLDKAMWYMSMMLHVKGLGPDPRKKI